MKACIICFNFRKENLRRQPWRYIYEISKSLVASGIEVIIITDYASNDIENVIIKPVDKLRTFLQETQEVIDIIKDEKPNVLITLLGSTSFVRPTLFNNIPIIGVLTSPLYTLRDVLNVGLNEYIRHFNTLYLHLIGSMIPNKLIKKNANLFKYIIVLSDHNKKKLLEIGVKDNVVLIPPGVDSNFIT